MEAIPARSNAEDLYAEREQRFNDIVALRKPDRVPVIPLNCHYFPTRVRGVTNRDAGYDSEARYRCLTEANIEFGWDMAVPSAVLSSQTLDSVGIKQLRWPGNGVADDAPFQFVEAEYLREDEYDAFLADPNGFTIATLLPRIAEGFAGLGDLPLPPPYWLGNCYHLAGPLASMLGAAPIRKALQSLLDLADAGSAQDHALAAHVGRMAALGYPFGYISTGVPAFDMVSDFLRGLRGGSLDLYRNPDKLLSAVGLMQPVVIGLSIAGAKMSGNPRVFIPMHRGADNFMNEEAFEKFYWPTFKAFIETLVAAGLTPVPFFEGHYDSRLKYLAQLPPGKIAAHFDHIDRKKFKDICGDVMCFWGNIPASLLCTGTPQQVKDEVKRLIDLFADTGALIIDGNQGIPDEAKPQNVLALREAADEYGVY